MRNNGRSRSLKKDVLIRVSGDKGEEGGYFDEYIVKGLILYVSLGLCL